LSIKFPALALAVLLMGIGAGCSVAASPAAPADDPVLTLGWQTYLDAGCANCHGSSGGGRRGPKLNEGQVIVRFPDIADQVEVVTKGKGGMPGFASKLSQEEIEAVVAYTREVLAGETVTAAG